MIKINKFLSFVLLSIIFSSNSVTFADDPERSSALAPISPLFGGTGVPGYRTNQFTGTATYEIPLKVPAGINEFQPDLTIRYNINNTEGSILGKGWELLLGRIVRSQRAKPADFTDDDAFILELGGIRDELVKVNNNEYTTLYKQRSLKVLKFSNYWTVQDGSGMTYRFDVEDQAEGAAGVWGWYLGKITEPHGNTINIQYVKKDGWQILDKITYSNREIRFITSQTTFNEFWPKFNKLGQSFMRYFLDRIEMYTNGSLYKKYEFVYNNIPSFKNKFLASIDELGSGGERKHIAAMTYESATEDVRFGAPVTFPDLPQPLGDAFLRIGEVDGDGRPDLMMSGFGDPVYYALKNENGWGTPRERTDVPKPCNTIPPCDFGFYQSHVRITDVDGDGLSDMVSQMNGSASSFGNDFYIAFGKGLGWENWKKNPNRFPYPLIPHNPPSHIFMTDINGDGRADVLNVSSNSSGLNITYALSEGKSGWRAAIQKTVPISDTSRFTDLDGGDTRLMDINHDGIDDLVYVKFRTRPGGTTGFYYLEQDNAYIFGNGSGFDAQVYTLNFSSTIDWYKVGNKYIAEYFSFNQNALNIIDLNNDGILDLVTKAQDLYQYMLGTENGFTDIKDLDDSNHTLAYNPFSLGNPNVTLFDFNNDGLIDFVSGTGKKYYPNITQTHFSPGILKTITDELGKKVTFTIVNSYEATQSAVPFRFPLLKKTEEEDNYSPKRSFNYDYFNPKYDRTEREFQGFGRVRETDAGGRWTDTFYFQDRPRLGFVEKTEQSSGSKATKTYTANTAIPYDNLLLSEKTEESGKEITKTFTYDDYGNVTQEIIDANNGDRFTTNRLFQPNTSAWLVGFPYQETVTDKNSSKKEVKFRYDGSNTMPTKGDLTREIRFLNTENKDIIIEYEYDSYGNRTQIKDPRGKLSKFKFDTVFNSFPIEIENHLGQKEIKTYWETGGGFGQIKTSTDFNGAMTQYFYDGFGRLSKVIGPNDADSFYGSVSYQYNIGTPGNNSTETFETRENGTASYHYKKESKDGFGQIVQNIQDGENGQTIYTKNNYDYRGNLLRSSLPGFGSPGADIVNVYDNFDRLTSTTYPGNHTTGFAYNGWQTTITDANNHWKVLTKDSRDRVRSVTEHGSYSTSYEYDIFDNLTKVTDHYGHIWTYGYDSLGRKITENDPDLGSMSLHYDDSGNLIEKTDALNRVLTFQYDDLNRLIFKDDLTTPGIDYSYFYDEPESTFGIGRRSRMIDPSGMTRFHYDNEGRSVREEISVAGFQDPFVLQWTYDAMDRVKTIIYPNARTINFIYNGQGLVESISEFLNNADYTALSQTRKFSYSNGVDTNYTYQSNDQRLSRIQSAAFIDLNYQYDQIGNIIGWRDDVHGWNKIYAYDELNRLTAGDGETFSYSAIGNITSRNGVAQLYGGLQPHALTYDGVNTYVYDAVGNMVSGAGRTIYYDIENRPYRIVRGGTTTEFVYNGDGERVLKIVSDGTGTAKTVYIGDLYEKEIIA